MTGSQIRAKVKELQALAKLQEKAPEKAAAKIAKAAAKNAVKSAAKTQKAVAKPVKKAAAVKSGGRTSTTEKRIRAMSWIPQNGLLALDKLDAIRKIMAEFDVPKNYAANWLKLAAPQPAV